MVTKRAEGVNENGRCSLFVIRYWQNLTLWVFGLSASLAMRPCEDRTANDKQRYAAGVISTYVSVFRQRNGSRASQYSRPAASDQVGKDFDAPGHIDTALLERIGVSQGSDFYLCGPPSFLQNMRDGLQKWGVLPGNVHTEIFGSLETITPGMAQVVHTPHLPQGPPGSGPSVSFARSGITAAWDPRFASLLELAEACDVPVRWSCRTGVCHTCMTGLIGGSITYNPEPLERPAPGNVLICCSQPNAGVTLDL